MHYSAKFPFGNHDVRGSLIFAALAPQHHWRRADRVRRHGRRAVVCGLREQTSSAIEMFARSVGGRILRNGSCIARRMPTTPIFRTTARRRFTSTATSLQDAGLSPATHPLAGVASQLDQVAPRFEIDPSEIEILDSPAAFYETLKVCYVLQEASSIG